MIPFQDLLDQGARGGYVSRMRHLVLSLLALVACGGDPRGSAGAGGAGAGGAGQPMSAGSLRCSIDGQPKDFSLRAEKPTGGFFNGTDDQLRARLTFSAPPMPGTYACEIMKVDMQLVENGEAYRATDGGSCTVTLGAYDLRARGTFAGTLRCTQGACAGKSRTLTDGTFDLQTAP